MPPSNAAIVTENVASQNPIPDGETSPSLSKDSGVVDGQADKQSVSAIAIENRQGSIAVIVIAIILGLHTVYFAQAILMPILAGAMLALLFRPIIRRMRRYRISDSVSAAITLIMVVGIIFALFANLIGPANEWLKDAPASMRTVGQKLHVIREQVDGLNRATEMVEDIAQGKTELDVAPESSDPDSADADSPVVSSVFKRIQESLVTVPTAVDESQESVMSDAVQDEPVEVLIQQPRLTTGLQVLSSTGSIMAELFIMLVLAYFLLASGDMLINNVLRILPSKREKRKVVELVHRVEQGISSYLLTVTAINLGLGIAIAVAMWLLGLPNPLLWGAMATLLNYIPVLGAIIGTAVVLFVSILSFDSLGYAFVPPAIYWLITAIEGNFVTPHLLGKSMSLNPIMVFLMLSIWGWMWGIGGALLAVPILAVLKVGFDQFERTRSLGTLLGGDANR